MRSRTEKTPEQLREEQAKKIVKNKNQFKGIQWLTKPASGWQINYKGIYSHEFFYKLMHTFLVEEGYSAIHPDDADGKSTGGDDRFEIMYEGRDSGGTREVWYEWRAKKTKFDEQCDWYIAFKCHLIKLTSKQVMWQGQKVEMNDVEMDSWLRGGIRWFFPARGGPKYIENIYGKDGQRLYKRYYFKERQKIEDDFYDELIKLRDQMMGLLGLPQHKGYRPFIFDPKGYPSLSTDAPNWEPNSDK